MSGGVPAPRDGDAIKIAGDYQHRARTEGFVVQRFWHAEKERVIRRHSMPAPGELVIDIGCGSGVIADFLARQGASVIAFDSNPSAIEYARRTFTRPGLTFRETTVGELELSPNSVDRAYCFELVEHIYLPQVRDLFKKVLLLTKPGGTLTVTTPNYAGVWPLIEKTLDLLKLVPKLDRDQHVTHFTEALLRKALTESGWDVRKVITFSTLAPWVSVLGWKRAERLANLEDDWNLRFGSILLAVAQKPLA